MTLPAGVPRRQQPDLGDLKSRLDCRDLYQSLVGTGRPSGKALSDRTPWRDDRKPSLNIYADGWIDRATGERGDVFSLVQRIRGISFSAAIEFVVSWLGIGDSPYTPPPARPRTVPSAASDMPPSQAWQTGAQKAVNEAERYLWSNHADSEAVRAYLRQERGLSDETLRHYQLGYNSTWRKISIDGQPHYLPPGIVIPWQLDGHLWSVKVRCRVGTLAQALGITEDTDRNGEVLAKYRQLGGGNQAGALFNVDTITPDKPVVFTEGELDAVLGQQIAGDSAAFVTAGSASSSLAVRWRGRVQDTSVILLALDNDEAGQKATERLAQTLSQPSRIAPLPAGKDLTDFVVQHHGDVQVWLANALLVPSPAGWTNLADGWRAALSQYLADSAAPLIEMLTAEGYLNPGTEFSASEVRMMATRRRLSASTVRAGLEAVEGILLENLGVLPIGSSKEGLSTGQGSKDGKTRRFSSGGRGKTNWYRVLPLTLATAALLKRAACRIWEWNNPVKPGQPLGKPQAGFFIALGYTQAEAEQIVVELDSLLQSEYHSQGNAERFSERAAQREYKRLKTSLANTTSTALPADWHYRNAHEYRTCFARAIKQANPDRNFSLKEWANRLGISVRSVAAVLVRAGIASVAQHQEEEVHSLDEARRAARRLKGYPRRLIIQTEGQQTRECRYDEEQLEGALRLGQRCTVRYQLVNRQTIATTTQDEQMEEKAPKPRLAPAAPMIITLPRERTKPPHYFGPGYNPAYVRAWVVQACDLVRGYTLETDGRLIDQETGELLAEEPTDVQLLELLRGRAVSVSGTLIVDDLLGWITQELGGVIIGMKRTNQDEVA